MDGVGWMGGFPFGWPGGLLSLSLSRRNTGKGSTWEGGMHEAGFAHWPGQIDAATRSYEVTSSMDVVPTVSALIGCDSPVPVLRHAPFPPTWIAARRRDADTLAGARLAAPKSNGGVGQDGFEWEMG